MPVHSVAEDKVLVGQAAIKNGALAEVNSAMIDLAVFNAKAAITSALQQVKNADQVLHTAKTYTQGLARCLRKAKQSLAEAWADTQMVCFTNNGVKHASIAMADVGARAVHAVLRTLRVQTLRVRTGVHNRSLDVLTKDIPITSFRLFSGDLGKGVVKAATAFRNYKALGDCFVLSGLSRPRLPRSMTWKSSTFPPSCGGKVPKPTGLGKGHVAPEARAWAPTNSLASPSSHSGSAPNRATSPSPSHATTKGKKVPTPDSGPQPLDRCAWNQEVTGAGPPAQTPPTPSAIQCYPMR